MATLNAEQVAAAAYIGGFRGSQLEIAIAVAFAESSFNTQAANSCCKGLWQINVQAHPQMTANVFDPAQNAKYAYKVYRSAGGWCANGSPPNCNPWQAYGNSNYKSYKNSGKPLLAAMKFSQDLKDGKTPQQVLGSGTGVIAGGVPSPGSLVGDAIGIIPVVNRVGPWITNPDNLARIAKVLFGGIVVAVSVAMLMDKQIMNVVPAGRILKKVVS